SVMVKDLPYGIPTFLSRSYMLTKNYIIEDEDQNENLKEGLYGFVWLKVYNTNNDYGKGPRLHAFHDGQRLLFPDFNEITDILIFSEELYLSQRLKLGYQYEIQ